MYSLSSLLRCLSKNNDNRFKNSPFPRPTYSSLNLNSKRTTSERKIGEVRARSNAFTSKKGGTADRVCTDEKGGSMAVVAGDTTHFRRPSGHPSATRCVPPFEPPSSLFHRRVKNHFFQAFATGLRAGRGKFNGPSHE